VSRATAATGAAFDGAAATYDGTFTETALGARLRQLAWSWVAMSFQAGDRVLELGCGTGVDAVHLAERGIAVVATDASAAMRGVAERRVILQDANDLVTIRHLEMSSIGDPGWADGIDGPFDGVFSDFGALNAVADRTRLLRALAGVVRPGGRLLLVVMGPLSPIEVGWYLLHREPAVAVRRWRAGAAARVEGGGRLRVWYPSARRVAREASPWFDLVDQGGIGVLLPPSGLALSLQRRRGWLRVVAPLDRLLGATAFGAWCSDHWVLDLVRRDA
jgi:SAM-dependent methyltransferase